MLGSKLCACVSDQAWYFFSFITLSRAMRDWRHFTAIKSASRALKAQAEAHLRVVALTRCLGVWRARAVALAEKAKRAQAVRNHMANFRRGNVLLSWHAVTVFVQSNRRAACLVLAGLSQGMANDMARNGLRAWKVRAIELG